MAKTKSALFREDYLRLAEMNTVLQRLIDERSILYRRMGAMSYGMGHSINRGNIKAIESQCEKLSIEINQRIDERNTFQAELRAKIKMLE